MENSIVLCTVKMRLNAFETSELNARLAQMAKYVADVTAPYAVIGHLNWLCHQAEPELRPRYEDILAALLKAIGEDFSKADSTVIAGICSCPFPDLPPLAREQLKHGDLEELHLRLMRVWKPFTDEREHRFAQRCAIAIVEAVRLHRLASREPPKPRRN